MVDLQISNQILAGKESLTGLKPFFSNWEETLQFYAQEMSQKFPADATAVECQICHRSAPEVKVAFDWRGRYDTRETMMRNAFVTTLLLAIGHLHYETKEIDFRTHHHFCRACARGLFWRQAGVGLIANSCMVVLFIAVLVLVCAAGLFAYYLYGSTPRGEIEGPRNVALASLGISLLAFWGTKIPRLFGLPGDLVGLGKRPFVCAGKSRE